MTPQPAAAQGLTIGDLARRTGLTPASLRAWETRYGFPTPQRLDSGHRRYEEHDVALVHQVLRRKDAGVRLETAIARRPRPAGHPWPRCSQHFADANRT